MLEWVESTKNDFLQWLFEETLGDPTGAVAVLLFIMALFIFKPTRIFAVGSILIYIVMI